MINNAMPNTATLLVPATKLCIIETQTAVLLMHAPLFVINSRRVRPETNCWPYFFIPGKQHTKGKQSQSVEKTRGTFFRFKCATDAVTAGLMKHNAVVCLAIWLLLPRHPNNPCLNRKFADTWTAALKPKPVNVHAHAASATRKEAPSFKRTPTRNIK